MSYERVWTVRFSDTDVHGIAHYPRIVDAVHETSDMFMEEIGWPFWRTQNEENFGLPIVEANFAFERPMRGGDKIVIELTPTLGTSSVRFDYAATREADGEPVFTAYEQRVCQETGAPGGMPVPDYLREAMTPYTEGGEDPANGVSTEKRADSAERANTEDEA